MSIRLFSTLTFDRQSIDSRSGHLKQTVTMKALVPGVNSGAYDKALYISVVKTEPFRFAPWLKWKFGHKHTMSADITLTVEEMTQLRNEINQILRLPFADKEVER